jgi:hypothetical protein
VKNNHPSLIEPISLRVFAITGLRELGEGRLDATYVAEARDDPPNVRTGPSI